MTLYKLSLYLTEMNGWLGTEERSFPLIGEFNKSFTPSGFGVGTLCPCLPRGGVIPMGSNPC